MITQCVEDGVEEILEAGLEHALGQEGGQAGQAGAEAGAVVQVVAVVALPTRLGNQWQLARHPALATLQHYQVVPGNQCFYDY